MKKIILSAVLLLALPFSCSWTMTGGPPIINDAAKQELVVVELGKIFRCANYEKWKASDIIDLYKGTLILDLQALFPETVVSIFNLVSQMTWLNNLTIRNYSYGLPDSVYNL
ncbi:MAG: hypothetical protein LBB12_04150, partial [Holosporaceae bacterium]|nr:hypothetical protein [Holosporaceae bacterium]